MTIQYLTINAGSSSIKFALYDVETLEQTASGTIAGIGFEKATLSTTGQQPETSELSPSDLTTAISAMQEWLAGQTTLDNLVAIGHRIVHGGPKFNESVVITPEVVEQLRELISFAPVHLPAEIQLIEAMQQSFATVPQVACFDTAFHHDLPAVARLLPIPRHYAVKGVRRYGFHGLSYTYLMEKLEQTAGAAVQGKIILAHLGNGVSLAAVQNGQVIDTSMGLTPASGVPMSTRSGDLDPGLVEYLGKTEGLSIEQFAAMAEFESGLRGLSETTSDMKKLLEIEHQDPRAAEAIALFCYQLKKYIGAYSAALGGLETLVFSGGMGEVAPIIRTRICAGLEFLGITIDEERNKRNEAVISSETSQVTVRVMHTDESLAMIKDMARITGRR